MDSNTKPNRIESDKPSVFYSTLRFFQNPNEKFHPEEKEYQKQKELEEEEEEEKRIKEEEEKRIKKEEEKRIKKEEEKRIKKQDKKEVFFKSINFDELKLLNEEKLSKMLKYLNQNGTDDLLKLFKIELEKTKYGNYLIQDSDSKLNSFDIHLFEDDDNDDDNNSHEKKKYNLYYFDWKKFDTKFSLSKTDYFNFPITNNKDQTIIWKSCIAIYKGQSGGHLHFIPIFVNYFENNLPQLDYFENNLQQLDYIKKNWKIITDIDDFYKSDKIYEIELYPIEDEYKTYYNCNHFFVNEKIFDGNHSTDNIKKYLKEVYDFKQFGEELIKLFEKESKTKKTNKTNKRGGKKTKKFNKPKYKYSKKRYNKSHKNKSYKKKYI